MSKPCFLLDEHVWGGLVEVGQTHSIDVVLVQTVLAEGSDDADVLSLAAQEGRVLLTSNAQDFAPLVADWFLHDCHHAGVIIVPGQTDKSLLSRALQNIVSRYTAESFVNTYRFIQEFI